MLVVVVLYVIAYFYYRYHALLFNPSRTLLPKPEKVKEIKISSISAYEVDNPSDYLILYFHGNNLNISYRNYVVNLAYLLNCSLVLPDYRGYGNSPGYSTISYLEEDSLEAYKYALTKNKKVIIWGESLGGYAATYCAKYKQADKLVLFSTFSSLETMVNPPFDYLFKLLPSLDIGKLLSDYEGEVIIIHSSEDSYIPYSQALRNYSMKRSKLLSIKGDHASPDMNEEEFMRLVSWLGLSVNKQQAGLWLDEVKRSLD